MLELDNRCQSEFLLPQSLLIKSQASPPYLHSHFTVCVKEISNILSKASSFTSVKLWTLSFLFVCGIPYPHWHCVSKAFHFYENCSFSYYEKEMKEETLVTCDWGSVMNLLLDGERQDLEMLRNPSQKNMIFHRIGIVCKSLSLNLTPVIGS